MYYHNLQHNKIMQSFNVTHVKNLLTRMRKMYDGSKLYVRERHIRVSIVASRFFVVVIRAEMTFAICHFLLLFLSVFAM